MQIGKVPVPKGRGQDEPRIEDPAANDRTILVPQQAGLLQSKDQVSISGDSQERREEIRALMSRVSEKAATVSEERIAELRELLRKGELTRPEVLEETARRILEEVE